MESNAMTRKLLNSGWLKFHRPAIAILAIFFFILEIRAQHGVDESRPLDRIPAQKTALPSAAETRTSVANVQEVFREEFSDATTIEKRAALARHLLSQAEKTPEPSDRWALFSEAMRLASDAGDLALCLDAITASAQHFSIETDAFTLDAITKIGAKATGDSLNGLAISALTIAKKAADSGKSQTAQKAISLASGFAKKAKNKTVVSEVTKLQQALRDREKNEKELAAIKAKLEASPKDPETCLDAGKYYCFKAGDWEKGLPLLAKGSDTDLARLATADINAGRDASSVLAVADAWWDWADAEKPPRKTAGFAHSAALYETVVAQTNGLERARLEKRIRQALTETGDSGKKMYLADLKETRASGLNMPLTKDGTYQGRPFTCGNRPWPKALVVMPSQEARIAYDLPPNAKRLVGKAGVFTPAGVSGSSQPGSPLIFEVFVDGRKVWASEPMPKRDDMASFEVELYGATQIELVTKCTKTHSAWTAWLDPVIVH